MKRRPYFWFNSNFLSDVRFGPMPEREQLGWVRLLCLACESSMDGVIKHDEEDVAFVLKFSDTEWEAFRSKLLRKKLLELTPDGKIRIAEWHLHQRPDNPYGRPSAEVWLSLREQVFERDDYTCQYCGSRGEKLNCDHVHPISRGGSNELDNLVTACQSCNLSKRNKTVEEWLAWLGVSDD